MKIRIADRGPEYEGLRWRAVWPDPATRREVSRSFRRKKDAEEFRTHMEHQLRSGLYRDPRHANKVFSDVAAEWLQSKLSVRDSTRSRSEQALLTWVLPAWGNRTIGSITRVEVQRWVAALSAGTAPHEYRSRREPKPLGANTVIFQLKCLSGPMAFALENDWIAQSPVRNIELPKKPRKRHVYLDHLQVEALADAAREISGRDTDAALVRFLAYTGVRIGEALALTRDPRVLRLSKGRIRIEQTWSQVGSRFVLESPKTGEEREVPIAPFLVPELMMLLESSPNRDGWLFSAARGGRIDPHNWRDRVWHPAVRAAGLGPLGLTPHKLRHTAASMAINANANVKVVQQMLGHATATETLDTYGHLWPDRLDEVSLAMNEAREIALRRDSSSRLPDGNLTAEDPEPEPLQVIAA